MGLFTLVKLTYWHVITLLGLEWPTLPQERAPAAPSLMAAHGSMPSLGSAAGQETSVPVLGYLCPAAITWPWTKANPNHSGTRSSRGPSAALLLCLVREHRPAGTPGLTPAPYRQLMINASEKRSGC